MSKPAINLNLEAVRAQAQKLVANATAAPAPVAAPTWPAKKVKPKAPALRQLNVRLSDEAHIRIRYAMNKWAMEQLKQGRQARASEQAFLEAWAMSLPAPPASDAS